MATINTKEQFIQYCLRVLGEPVIKVNLDPEQIEDAVDDAILQFTEYHRDGYEEYFYIYTVPEPVIEGDRPSREIIIPENLQIDDVIEVIPAGSTDGGRFDTYAWQAGVAITSPEQGGWAASNLQDFVAMQQRLKTLSATLGEELVIKHNKYQRKITLMFEAVPKEVYAFRTYRRNDPNKEGSEDAWNDPWLKAYAVAMIGKRWGNVLTKVSGVRLVGGVEINGAEILSNALTEIEKLNEQVRTEHQIPPQIFIG